MRTSGEGHSGGRQFDCPDEKMRSDLVGRANETEVVLNGEKCKSLLDTGSSVSTISQKCYESLFSKVPLHSIGDILDIEGATGQKLPYLGCVALEVQLPDQPFQHECLFLVVPNTRYNSVVPVLLGTNILGPLMETLQKENGQRYLQTAYLSTPWQLAFQCLLNQDHQLWRSQGRLGIVKNASNQKVIVPSNSIVTLSGYMQNRLAYRSCSAMTMGTTKSGLPEIIEISPALVHYTPTGSLNVPVQLRNLSSQDVVIQPSAILCELQPVTVQDQFEEVTSLG